MNISFFKRFTIERSLFFIMVAGILIVFVSVFYLFFVYGTKSIKVLSPNGGEEWEIGQTFQVTWQARGVEKVGIVLFKGKEPKWIAKDIPAGAGEYEWKIYPGQEYGAGFWIAIVEYPWREGNKIDYSDASFVITYPLLDTCEVLSANQEWSYLPNNFPNLRRVFITEQNYKGNLDGLEGADKLCQQEAEKNNLEGKWQAFLGGDNDEETAVKRLEKTPRGKEGIFIEAKSALKLNRGDTCHRLLAKNFDEFLVKLSDLQIISAEKLDNDFLENLDKLWLGRVNKESKKNCIAIAQVILSNSTPLVEKYSFTATCQNWTQEKRFVDGYPIEKEIVRPSFSTCYTAQGKFTEAVALAGLSSDLQGKGKDTEYNLSVGKYCDNPQKLLCVEK